MFKINATCILIYRALSKTYLRYIVIGLGRSFNNKKKKTVQIHEIGFCVKGHWMKKLLPNPFMKF